MSVYANQGPRKGSAAGLLVSMSACLLALQVVNIALWIRAFNTGHSQDERVALYLATLPAALSRGDVLRVTLLMAACAVIGGMFALAARHDSERRHFAAARLLTAANGVLLVWYVFTMM